MGLDMYAFATRTAPATPVDFNAGESQELAYWRKHPNLHGWMEHLYRAKGGTADDFNCVNLQLDAADLDALEHAVRSRTLPPTTGFFFGQTDGCLQCDHDWVIKHHVLIFIGVIARL